MANKFSTSVNIIRDSSNDVHYIPTPNARQVVNQIVNDFKKGLRSFNIIGTYGTGKSSFLLALEKSIQGKKRYYETNFISNGKYEFIKFVGSYNSIIDEFCDRFDVQVSKNKNEIILSEIFNKYHSIDKKNGMLFILIDEFGKYLEYASKNNPENELYFIQQLAEFCNNPKYNIVFITTVHQSFDSYAFSLSSTQKQEWSKVKGRFREITFNEPVEQLLFLASEFINSNFVDKTSLTQIEKNTQLAVKTKSFSFSKSFVEEIAPKLFPLDLLSANALTLALQRYGQNERSLFTFLESTDHTGITRYRKSENPFYNLSNVYDYLNFNFYSFLTSKFNPDFSSWSTIRSSLEVVERVFDDSINDYFKAIKIIGMLNLFSANGSLLEVTFLAEYLKLSAGVKNSIEVLQQLEKKQIIRYRQHNNKYILFEGTDLDIQKALIDAGNKLSEVNDVTTLLNRYFKFTPVFAKLYSYEKGTPRFFEFEISEFPISKKPFGEIDGYINLIFNSKLKAVDVIEKSRLQKEAIVYCFFKNSIEIKSLLFEIEKIQKVIDENKDDKVAKRELDNIVESQIRLLNHYISESIYSNSSHVKWFFKGEEKKIVDKKDFNKLLSQVCSSVYHATPVFRNELVNKHKISASIHSAKRNYFKALANNWSIENLGFDENKFPPEKTIYLSLLKENEINLGQNSGESPLLSRTSSFNKLWKASIDFLEKAKSEERNLIEFVELLQERPFKLKQGFIDFWVPTFLFINRHDFALFNDNAYIPNLSDENLELLSKTPDRYSLKTFDIEGVKLDIFKSYRNFLNQNPESKINNTSFIETIKPFIIFYKGLPEYSKHTKRLGTAAINIRNAIAFSKDPEATFFEAFPSALGISIDQLQKDKNKLSAYTSTLQGAIRELRTSYDSLLQRFEDFICDEFVGEKCEFIIYKSHLQKRFKELKKHLLLVNQKTFIQRIDSQIEDKKAWLNSIAQAITGKTLESFLDSDEIMLYEKFKSIVLELDSLTNISLIDIDETKEEIIGVKIDTFFSSINPKLVRIPKNKSAEINEIQKNLKKKLTADKTSNIAAILNLLKELLQ
jgi:hypothetical protein